MSTALVELLSQEGFITAATDDGADALRILGEFQPDVMLLDLIMPRATLDGFALLARLRESRTPIIVMSALGAGLGDALRGRVASVLTKPLSVDAVAREIKRFIEVSAARE